MFTIRLKLRKFIKDKSGSATIYFIVILSALMIAESILIQGLTGLKSHHEMNERYNANVRSYFSNYNKKLSTYGLYGVEFASRNPLNLIRNSSVSSKIRVQTVSNMTLEDDLLRQIKLQMKFELLHDLVKKILGNKQLKNANNVTEATAFSKNSVQYKNEFENYKNSFLALEKAGITYFNESRLLEIGIFGQSQLENLSILINKVDGLWKLESKYTSKYNRQFILGDQLFKFRAKLTELLALMAGDKSNNQIRELLSSSFHDFSNLRTEFNNKIETQIKFDKEINQKINKESSKLSNILYSCPSDPIRESQQNELNPVKLTNESLKELGNFNHLPEVVSDNTLLSEFTINKFTYRTFSNSDNPAFTYPHASTNSEIESILTGDATCSIAQSKILFRIFLLRFGTHFVEELTSTKNQILSVNPWTLLLTISLKSIIKSINDVEKLVKGEALSVSSLFKLNIKMRYVDFLRVLLYLTPNRLKQNRLQNLIELNLGVKFRELLTSIDFIILGNLNSTNSFFGKDNFRVSFSY